MSTFMNNQFNPKKHKLYKPQNPEKYAGDPERIVSRSSYEWRFCKWLDSNPNVLEWASEAIEIPYFDPGKMKKRRYYPDYYMKVRNADGKVVKYIIEIKPSKECRPPVKRRNRKQAALLKEQATWTTNQAKWKAADAYCKNLASCLR